MNDCPHAAVASAPGYSRGTMQCRQCGRILTRGDFMYEAVGRRDQ